MKTDTKHIISVSDASSRGLSWLIDEAISGREPVLLRHSKAAAVVVSTATMERLEALEETAENLRLSVIALTRMHTDNGRRYDLADVAAELGVDLDDDEDDETED